MKGSTIEHAIGADARRRVHAMFEDSNRLGRFAHESTISHFGWSSRPLSRTMGFRHPPVPMPARSSSGRADQCR
jgi:hypothetical protein